MKGLLFLACMCFSALSFAGTGSCAPVDGVHVLSLSFPLIKVDASKNEKGYTMIDVAHATSPLDYNMRCTCDAAHVNSTDFYEIFYTADPASNLIFDRVISGINFYALNDYLSVGVKIKVAKVGYFAVPFEHVSNQSQNPVHTCGPGRDGSQMTMTTGTDSQLSFYLRRSVTGLVTIPATDVALLYGGISNSFPREQAIAKVRIQGSLQAPQSCEINSDQVINIDFNSIPASEFPPQRGDTLTGRKVTKTVNVQCTGMSEVRDQQISTSFWATDSSADSAMVATSNPAVGIKIFDKNGKAVNVTGGLIATDMGSTTLLGHKDGSLTFSAVPASFTGDRPEPGTFTATATLTIEFIN